MWLTIDLPKREYGEEDGNDILLKISPAQKITLEHSLYTISKWEAKYHKSFIKEKNKTPEQMEYYVRCMIVKPEYSSPEEIDKFLIFRLMNEGNNNERISNFLNDTMTATYFRPDPNKPQNTETITSELIYYWMVKCELPVDLMEHWHINRLLVLIEVFSRKDAPKKRRSARSIMEQNDYLNEQRKKQWNTRG